MEIALLCAEIFCCRIIDVSCCTIRTVLTVKEKTALASIVGFFEAFMWFVVVRQALTSETTGIFVAIAYGGGFAAGTFIGGKLAKALIRSNMVLEIVTSKKDQELIKTIQAQGYAITVVDTHATDYGPEKYLIIAEISSTRFKDFKKLLYSFDPTAFVIVQESKYVFNGMVRK